MKTFNKSKNYHLNYRQYDSLVKIINICTEIITSRGENVLKTQSIAFLSRICGSDHIWRIVLECKNIWTKIIKFMISISDSENEDFRISLVMASQLIASSWNQACHDFISGGILNIVYLCKNSEDSRIHFEILLILQNLAVSSSPICDTLIADYDIRSYVLDSILVDKVRVRNEALYLLKIWTR